MSDDYDYFIFLHLLLTAPKSVSQSLKLIFFKQ